MAWLTSVGQGVLIGLSLLIIAGIIWLIWKRALLDIQQKAMNVQTEVIEAYAARITQLEEGREQDAAAMDEMRTALAELRGELQGQRDLAKAIIETIADTRVCLAAPDCVNRIVPTV